MICQKDHVLNIQDSMLTKENLRENIILEIVYGLLSYFINEEDNITTVSRFDEYISIIEEHMNISSEQHEKLIQAFSNLKSILDEIK